MRCWLYWPQIFSVCHIHSSDFCLWAKTLFSIVKFILKKRKKKQQLLEAVLLPSFFVSTSPYYFLLLFQYSLYVPWKCAKDKIVSPVLRKRCCLDRFPPCFTSFSCLIQRPSELSEALLLLLFTCNCTIVLYFLFPGLSADLTDCLFLSHICVFIPVSVAASFLALLPGSPHASTTVSIPLSTVLGLSPLWSILHTTKHGPSTRLMMCDG